MSREADLRVVVLDMQPIDPPVGGGRIRPFGLYQGLGLPAVYVGSFDWPDESAREISLSPTLREVDVPLGRKHLEACARLEQRRGLKPLIDVTFPRLARGSPEFIARASREAEDADVVVFSHPWVYPLIRARLRPDRQLIVYDAQNVEGLLRCCLFDDQSGPGSRIVRRVIETELSLCRAAHLVLACSGEDARLFHDLYGVPFERIRVVPNGAFADRTKPASPEERREAKRGLDLEGRTTALFTGSDYRPNREAAEFIVSDLALRVPKVLFVIAGGVGANPRALGLAGGGPPNVRVTGGLDRDRLNLWLAASDLAVNPVTWGSGSNIKMFEFLAAGLPVVTTEAGARGVEPLAEEAVRIRTRSRMARAVRDLADSEDDRSALSAAARRLVETRYAFERISPALGRLFARHGKAPVGKKPLFSVIVPTLDRPSHLTKLMECLSAQTCRDFEVVVVDQTPTAWAGRGAFPALDLFYFQHPVRGAVLAKNLGAFVARGSVLAFTDDDCRPAPDWLKNASVYFGDPGVVGVEGLIRSDRIGDPEYRWVSNENFRGFGFMTANLFLRQEDFNALGGFDLRFDNPHFREDTDLGWRALERGSIPFGFDVQVFHPAHLRGKGRESLAERNRFFEKDALLLKKHPARFRELFLAETENKTPDYLEHFLRGCRIFGVNPPAFYLSHLKKTIENR